MKKLLILVFAVCMFTTISALAEHPIFTTNTVYMDTVNVKVGENFTVNVYLFNTDTLAGCQIPIFFRSENIKLWCDSISFVGSRFANFGFNDVKLPQKDEDDKVAYFTFINTINPESFIDPLPPGDGLIATLYFACPTDTPEGTVTLKRGMVPDPHISFIFAVWTPAGEETDGEFIGSEIRIKK